MTARSYAAAICAGTHCGGDPPADPPGGAEVFAASGRAGDSSLVPGESAATLGGWTSGRGPGFGAGGCVIRTAASASAVPVASALQAAGAAGAAAAAAGAALGARVPGCCSEAAAPSAAAGNGPTDASAAAGASAGAAPRAGGGVETGTASLASSSRTCSLVLRRVGLAACGGRWLSRPLLLMAPGRCDCAEGPPPELLWCGCFIAGLWSCTWLSPGTGAAADTVAAAAAAAAAASCFDASASAA